MAWNDDKKDKDDNIIRKLFVSSCGTTLPDTAHRWRVGDDGHASTYYTYNARRKSLQGITINFARTLAHRKGPPCGAYQVLYAPNAHRKAPQGATKIFLHALVRTKDPLRCP